VVKHGIPSRAPQSVGNVLWKLSFFVGIYSFLWYLYQYCDQTLQLSEFHMTVTVTEWCMFVPFWGLNLALTFVDYFQWPHFLFKHKLQPKVHIGAMGHFKVITVVLLNQLLMSVPLQTIAFPLFKARGVRATHEMPSVFEVIWHIILMVLIEEIGFYYSHRLFHSNEFLYRYVHSLHHSFSAPVGTASLYVHPIEFLIANAAPIMAGPLLTGCHVFTVWVWVTLTIITTINGHSGYAFPWTPFAPAILHDIHHSTYQSNYGAIGLLDWVHGTRYPFEKYSEGVRPEADKILW